MKDRIDICVMVSGGGTNLQTLIDEENKGNIRSGKISLVVSSSGDAYALTRAAEAGIETYVMKGEEDLLQCLKDHDIDMIVLAGFLKILSPAFIDRYRNRIINVHPSLIPSFCGDGCYGLKVHRMALDKGVKITGATVHFVDEITDGGKIIAQKPVEVREDDSPESLQKRVMEEAEWIILPMATEDVAAMIRKGEI